MSHYFSSNPNISSNPQIIKYQVKDKIMNLWSDAGTFSAYHLDIGTQALLETLFLKKEKVEKFWQNLEALNRRKKINSLDLGCGMGVIFSFFENYLSENFDIKWEAIDVNKRSVDCAKKNKEKYNLKTEIFEADAVEFLSNKLNFYDLIVSNPPIRIGKNKLHQILSLAISSLTTEGILLLVVGKKQGSASLQKWLEAQNLEINILNRQYGFDIILAKIK